MSLACHLGEPSFEVIEQMPAHEFDSWRRYAASVGGVTPPFAEILVFAMVEIAKWQGTNVRDASPLRFKDVFLPYQNTQQSAEEISATIAGAWGSGNKT